MRAHGPVTLCPLADVRRDAVVLPVAMMGAPTVMIEKLPSTEQVGLRRPTLAGYLGRELTHIACAEAGGVNSLIPVVAAAQLGLPLVDADGMGRAFPELQMVLPTLYGISGDADVDRRREGQPRRAGHRRQPVGRAAGPLGGHRHGLLGDDQPVTPCPARRRPSRWCPAR